MEKSIKSAFTSMFKDQNWLLKVEILALLLLPAMAFHDILATYSKIHFTNFVVKELIYILMLSIFVLTSCLTMGYANKYSNIVMNTNSDSQEPLLLPCWKNNIWEYIKSGFMLYFATYLLVILGFGIMFLGFHNKILAGILSAFLLIAALALLIMGIAIHAVFCTDFRLKSFFAWKKAYKLIAFAPGKYFWVILVTVLTTVIVSLVAALVKFSPWLYIVSALVSAYFLNVWAYLKGYLFPTPPAEFFSSAQVETVAAEEPDTINKDENN